MRCLWTKLVNLLEPYGDRRVLAMCFLGFSAGLPFLLVFSTLSAWLSQAQIDRATIGMMSWVGLAYALKFFWAPVVDRLPLPLLTRYLGRRRAWMLLSQSLILLGLFLLSQAFVEDDLGLFVLIALLVAFSSATQDIVVDAWRIEIVPEHLLGAMAAIYQLGYRVAIWVSGAGAFWIAASHSWQDAYFAMAVLMSLGIVTTLLIAEPENKPVDEINQSVFAWFIQAVVGPFKDFLTRFGIKQALFILVFIGFYRMTDYTMGVMANPFYLEMGFTLKQISAVVETAGLITLFLGAMLGGALVANLGMIWSLRLGIGLVLLTNVGFLGFAALGEANLWGLYLVISADNLAAGVAGTALIAYLSSLTSRDYTATQYALFSSFYALPGKVAMGFSGFVVNLIEWPGFFLYTTLLGLPALIMVARLARYSRKQTYPRKQT